MTETRADAAANTDPMMRACETADTDPEPDIGRRRNSRRAAVADSEDEALAGFCAKARADDVTCVELDADTRRVTTARELLDTTSVARAETYASRATYADEATLTKAVDRIA